MTSHSTVAQSRERVRLLGTASHSPAPNALMQRSSRTGTSVNDGRGPSSAATVCAKTRIDVGQSRISSPIRLVLSTCERIEAMQLVQLWILFHITEMVTQLEGLLTDACVAGGVQLSATQWPRVKHPKLRRAECYGARTMHLRPTTRIRMPMLCQRELAIAPQLAIPSSKIAL